MRLCRYVGLPYSCEFSKVARTAMIESVRVLTVTGPGRIVEDRSGGGLVDWWRGRPWAIAQMGIVVQDGIETSIKE